MGDDRIVTVRRTAAALLHGLLALLARKLVDEPAYCRLPEFHFIRPEELPFSWLAVVTRQHLEVQVGVRLRCCEAKSQ